MSIELRDANPLELLKSINYIDSALFGLRGGNGGGCAAMSGGTRIQQPADCFGKAAAGIGLR